MTRFVRGLIILGLLNAGPYGAHAETLVIPAETAVIVKLVETISSASHKKGDAVRMEVAQDVYVQGKKVIPAGTPVEAAVEDAAKRFIAGIGGYLKISVRSVKTVSGTAVPLKLTQESTGKASLWSIICTIVCCCIFVFIPGEDVSIAGGTLFNAITASNIELQL